MDDRFSSWQWTLLHTKFWQSHRILGRFRTWRRTTRVLGRASRPWLAAAQWPATETAFASLSATDVTAGIRDHGYHCGLSLPAHLVAEICRHAEESYCWRTPRDPERFLIRDVRDGRSPLGKPVAVADVDASACPATARVAGDAALVEVARHFLGYSPRRVATRLFWSPMSDLSDAERRWSGQTIDYHYDIEPANALYVYFYLTDVDWDSGAHVVVAGSHNSKPLRMMFASTRQPERLVLEYYGVDKVVVLGGKAGFGFFEDPACFHKVLPPRHSNRLMLQMRYS